MGKKKNLLHNANPKSPNPKSHINSAFEIDDYHPDEHTEYSIDIHRDDDDVRWNIPNGYGAENGSYEERDYRRYDSSTSRRRKHKKSPSTDLLRELPSRNIATAMGEDIEAADDDVDGICMGSRATLRKSEAKFATLRLKSGVVNLIRRPLDVDRVYELLTKDPEMSLEEMKETLRDMNQCLTIKREVSQRLSKVEERRSHHLPLIKWMKYTVGMGLQQLKYSVREILYSFDLWHSYLKTIQGHFGNSIASYFLFLRWLFLLNCFTFFIIFAFVIIPQILWDSSKEVYNSTKFEPQDIITGENYFQDTLLYYGHYTNNTISLDSRHFYDMRLAYFLTMAFYLLLSLITVSYSLGKSYRENYVETAGDLKNVFVNKIFCAWDFSIETKNASQLKSKSIYNEIKELLSRQKKPEENMSFKYRLRRFLIWLACNVIFVAFLCGTGYLTYEFLRNKYSLFSFLEKVPWLREMLLSVVVTFIIFVLPVILPKLLFYSSPQKALYSNMFRIVILKIIVLGMVVYFWLYVDQNTDQCWESELGQEMYRLFMVHFIFLIFYTLIGDFLHRLITTKLLANVLKKPEFDIACNILDLIYIQTLSWVGIFFSPLLSFMTIIKLFIIFHSKRWSLMLNFDPATKPWKSAHMQTMFLLLTLFNFILGSAAAVITVFYRSPSKTCGPFKNSATAHYDVIFDYLDISESSFQKTFKYIFSTPSIFGCLIIMCVIIYNMRASANARKEMVNLLRDQVIMEGKDKAYLLKLYDMVVEQRKRLASPQRAKAEQSNEDGATNIPVTDPRGSLPESQRNVSDEEKPVGIVNEHYREHSLHWTEASMPENVPFPVRNNGYMPAEVPVNNVQGFSQNFPKPGWRSQPDVQLHVADEYNDRHKFWSELSHNREHMQDKERRFSDDSSQMSDQYPLQHKRRSVELPYDSKIPIEDDYRRRALGSHSDTESSGSYYRDSSRKKQQPPKSKFPPLPQTTHQLGFQYLNRDTDSPPFTPRSLRGSYSPIRDSPNRKGERKKS